MRRGASSVHSSSGSSSSSSSDTDDGDEPHAEVARRGGGGLVPAAAYGQPLTYTDESSSSSSSSSSDGEETTTQLSFEETTDRKQETQAEDTATFVHHATSSDDEEEEDVTAVTATATTATTQEPEEQTEPSQQQKRAKKKAKGGEPKRKEKEIDNKKERTRGGDLIKEGYALSGHGNGSRQRWSRRSSVSKRRLLSSNVKKQRVLLRQPSLEDTPIYYLCLAVREGNLDDVQNLLDNAKDKSLVNQRHTAKNNYSPMSYTPLQYAIKYDQPEILQYLMEKKADPRIKSLEHVFEDDDGMIPNTNSSSSLITKNRSKRDVASDDTTYLSKVESRNAFHIAAQFGRSELLEAILTFKETYATARSVFLYSFLFVLLTISFFHLLVDYGPFRFLPNIQHYHTVMSLAIKNKCGPEIARVLHDFNYDISGIPTEGTPEWETYNTVTKRSKRATLLYAVKRCDDVGFIRFLISNARQDVNMRTYKMTTPTHMAAKYGASKILRYLIKKGALVDPLNATQETPLCKSLETYYQSRAKLEAVQELEPYHLAKAKKFYREAIETTNHLLDCKATLKFARTSAGTSPLYYIVDKNLRPFIKHKRVQQELKTIWRLNMKFSYTWWTQNWWHMLTHPKTQFWLSFFAYFLFLILLTVLMLLTNTDMHTEAYYFESSIRGLCENSGRRVSDRPPSGQQNGFTGFFP
ncbi:Nuclear factor NF-kappa-B p100 subunit [Balamuthia mandrillaris]